jgi:hypothetical protein
MMSYASKKASLLVLAAVGFFLVPFQVFYEHLSFQGSPASEVNKPVHSVQQENASTTLDESPSSLTVSSHLRSNVSLKQIQDPSTNKGISSNVVVRDRKPAFVLHVGPS